MKSDLFITESGYNDALKELEVLRNAKVRIREELKTTSEYGDLRENSEFDAAVDTHLKNEARIKDLEYLIENAQVITNPKSNIVDIGSCVTVEYMSTHEYEKFILVGKFEAKNEENKISITSPMGKALYKNKVNKILTIESPNGKYDVKIVKID